MPESEEKINSDPTYAKSRLRPHLLHTMGVPFRTTDGEAQIVAVRQGLGMTILPCFVGDADPLLVRVPDTDLHMHGTLWLLTQGETRKTKRVRLFTEFVSRRLAAYAPLLGLSVSRTK
jgi:DNA-binding transcriptional LysR family regulator